MESDKELKLRISVTYVESLEKAIENHNEFCNTDFQIVNIDYDEVILCDLKVTKYKQNDIFSLGYKLGILEQKIKKEGRK